jgi:CTP synthase (UTP-ammonia lyase)
MSFHHWTFWRDIGEDFGMTVPGPPFSPGPPPYPLAAAPPPRLALVGDRSESVQAHAKIPVLIDALATGASPAIEIYWLRSTDITGSEDVAGFDGVWVIPGSPYLNLEGVLAAIQAARSGRVPLLGTCGGFQHVLLEFARDVCGLTAVEHAEENADAAEPLIVPLECSLLGQESTVVIAPGTVAAKVMGPGPTTERYFCRYGLNADYLEILNSHGLVFSGRDERGEVRVAELPGHPFYVASLFQPELSSDSTWVHPLIAAFAAAVRSHAAALAGVAGT